MVLTPPSLRVAVTAVVVALVTTGFCSARVGGAQARAIARVGDGGIPAMAVTYGIGALVGTQIG